MSTDLRDIDNDIWLSRALALSGIGNSVFQVDRLAKTGSLNSELFEQTLKTLFIQSPDHITDIYEPLSQLRDGTELLTRIFSSGEPKASYDTTRYLMSLLYLQNKVSSHKTMLGNIADGLADCQLKIEHFSLTHESVVSSLADIYSKNISSFTHRIHVKGDSNILQQSRCASQIRALLLCGIRSAVLWEQVGGSRLQLIFRRSKIVKHLNHLQRYF